MFKMTDACRYHRNAMFITIIERQFILYRTTRLDNSCNTFITCYLHTVREGEESICGPAE